MRPRSTNKLVPNASSARTSVSSSGNLVLAQAQKRKATENTEDSEGSHLATKTRRVGGRARDAPSAQKPQAKSARSAYAPDSPRVLNQAPTQVLAVYVFGTGDCGELGLGPAQQEALRPRINRFLDPTNTEAFRVVQLACGGMHVVALTEDNKIISWGVNDNCALGRDTNWKGPLRDMDTESSSEDNRLNPFESTPTPIPSDSFPPGTVFVQVAAGDSCSLALTDTGLVYGWGTFLSSDGKPGFFYNSSGRLIELQPRPHLLPGLKDITQIACGANHALALDSSGNIWAWGNGEQSQLGRRILQRRANLSFVPHRVEICRKNAKYISSGQYHSFAVDNHDNVWAWGLNSYGEARYIHGSEDSASLPYPMKIPSLCGKDVVMLSGGAHHSVAVTAGGECFVWGRIDGGQLGIDFSADQLADRSLILRDDRNKPRICAEPVAVTHIGKVSHVSCGTDHTIFIDKDGKAYSAGFGSMGQLGLGDEDEVPVARMIEGKALRDRILTWTGAGGQFSLVAGS